MTPETVVSDETAEDFALRGLGAESAAGADTAQISPFQRAWLPETRIRSSFAG